jgi:hypothetical protein
MVCWDWWSNENILFALENLTTYDIFEQLFNIAHG